MQQFAGDVGYGMLGLTVLMAFILGRAPKTDDRTIAQVAKRQRNMMIIAFIGLSLICWEWIGQPGHKELVLALLNRWGL